MRPFKHTLRLAIAIEWYIVSPILDMSSQLHTFGFYIQITLKRDFPLREYQLKQTAMIL